jgi:hypothetical protein
MSIAATDLSVRAQQAKSATRRSRARDRQLAFQYGNRCPFWLDFAKNLSWDPRREINSFEDLRKFPPFED